MNPRLAESSEPPGHSLRGVRVIYWRRAAEPGLLRAHRGESDDFAKGVDPPSSAEAGPMAFPGEDDHNLGSAFKYPAPESVVIGPYEKAPAACKDHDLRFLEVAKRVGRWIESHLPAVAVEHVGSTAVPGCAGKGILDLMVLYEPGRLVDVRDGLDALGFQRQTGRDPFPEERPMRVGSIEYDGTRFWLHAHVIASDSPEVVEFRTFRDRLRDEPILLEQYVALKRQLIGEGVTDRLAYTIRKGEFIAQMLRSGGIAKVNIREKLALFDDHWSPKIGQHVKLVKFRGEFVWHKHDDADELFLVIQGRFRMEYRDRHVWLEEGEFLIVPRGVEHRPVADEEVHVLLFEPTGTRNTGNVEDERTVPEPERI
jgi:GrpB-like predicted nucleotidyltransferase (UPF0157 family)/mannose-6-phosphate isomerase-like protein (cupin superfamily)